EVLVEGQFVGLLVGFRFVADAAEGAVAAKAVLAAASRSLKPEIAARVDRLSKAPDQDFRLDSQGRLLWLDQAVGRLVPGHSPLSPQVEVFGSDLLETAHRDRIHKRLNAYVDWAFESLTRALRPGDDLPRNVRGLLHQLAEGLGSVPRAQAQAQIAHLEQTEHRLLAARGIRLGTEAVFLPALLKPAVQQWRGLLWAIHHGTPIPDLPFGRVSLGSDLLPVETWQAMGYRCLGPMALRLDMVERLCALLREKSRSQPDGFTLEAGEISMTGLSSAHLPPVLAALGWKSTPQGWRRNERKKTTSRKKRKAQPDSTSPFAILLQHRNANR
ncbi:MAG: disulfide oxidoreductase, partial [Magnetospirillum sp.]